MTGGRLGPGSGGNRVVASLLGGGALGVAAALLLHAAIQRTATPLSPERAFWQLVLLGFAGALAGFALSAVSSLQAANPDPDYHRPRRSQRPTGRPPRDRH